AGSSGAGSGVTRGARNATTPASASPASPPSSGTTQRRRPRSADNDRLPVSGGIGGSEVAPGADGNVPAAVLVSALVTPGRNSGDRTGERFAPGASRTVGMAAVSSPITGFPAGTGATVLGSVTLMLMVSSTCAASGLPSRCASRQASILLPNR